MENRLTLQLTSEKLRTAKKNSNNNVWATRTAERDGKTQAKGTLKALPCPYPVPSTTPPITVIDYNKNHHRRKTFRTENSIDN